MVVWPSTLNWSFRVLGIKYLVIRDDSSIFITSDYDLQRMQWPPELLAQTFTHSPPAKPLGEKSSCLKGFGVTIFGKQGRWWQIFIYESLMFIPTKDPVPCGFPTWPALSTASPISAHRHREGSHHLNSDHPLPSKPPSRPGQTPRKLTA